MGDGGSACGGRYRLERVWQGGPTRGNRVISHWAR